MSQVGLVAAAITSGWCLSLRVVNGLRLCFYDGDLTVHRWCWEARRLIG